MKILLIAGHGGTPYDPGAVGCGYTEAVETRRMVRAVAPLLRAYGFEVALYDQSRDAYKVVRGGGRLPLAGVDYVLEFHLNAGATDEHGNGRTTGAEIFVHRDEPGVTVEQAILRRVCALGLQNRGVKRGNFAVLKHVHERGVSHALVETCFIDDKDDMKVYAAQFRAIAAAIAAGVAEGFGRPVQSEEGAYLVQRKTIAIDGAPYPCSVIVQDGENYVRLRDFVQAGYGVTYDAKTKVPGVVAPQTRTAAEADASVQAHIDAVRAATGLSEATMAYLLRYRYGDALLRKLAEALRQDGSSI
ncbi:MAG: N-acetylmuramoyl-L-alanine amidase [Eubacteriales bacterium]|nr:N-acetylmuramoyl-L-alanine amidase [Eubacteriales bacterium]